MKYLGFLVAGLAVGLLSSIAANVQTIAANTAHPASSPISMARHFIPPQP